jgi:hypothetical protein
MKSQSQYKQHEPSLIGLVKTHISRYSEAQEQVLVPRRTSEKISMNSIAPWRRVAVLQTLPLATCIDNDLISDHNAGYKALRQIPR